MVSHRFLIRAACLAGWHRPRQLALRAGHACRRRQVRSTADDVGFQSRANISPPFSFDPSLLVEPDRLALKWISGYHADAYAADMQDWNSSQICGFLDRLQSAGVLSAALLSAMDRAYRFSESTNPEIKWRWLVRRRRLMAAGNQRFSGLSGL